jgi:hypothetical protein
VHTSAGPTRNQAQLPGRAGRVRTARGGSGRAGPGRGRLARPPMAGSGVGGEPAAADVCRALQRQLRVTVATALAVVEVPDQVLHALCVFGASGSLRQDVVEMAGASDASGRATEQALACVAMLLAVASDGAAQRLHAGCPHVLALASAAATPAGVAAVWRHLQRTRHTAAGCAPHGAVGPRRSAGQRAEWGLLSCVTPAVLPALTAGGGVVPLPTPVLDHVWARLRHVGRPSSLKPAGGQLAAALGALALHNPLSRLRPESVACGGEEGWPADAGSLWLRGADDESVLSCRLCLRTDPAEWPLGHAPLSLYYCAHRDARYCYSGTYVNHEPLFVLVLPRAAIMDASDAPEAVALVFKSEYACMAQCVRPRGAVSVTKLKATLQTRPMTVHTMLGAAERGDLAAYCRAALLAAAAPRAARRAVFHAHYSPAALGLAIDAFTGAFVDSAASRSQKKDKREKDAQQKLIAATNRLRPHALDGGGHRAVDRQRVYSARVQAGAPGVFAAPSARPPRSGRTGALRALYAPERTELSGGRCTLYAPEAVADLVALAAAWRAERPPARRAAEQEEEAAEAAAARRRVDAVVVLAAARLVAEAALAPKRPAAGDDDAGAAPRKRGRAA